MTSFEIAFMKSLIMATYRRNLIRFTVEMVGLAVIFFACWEIPYMPTESWRIITVLTTVFYIARLLFIYEFGEDEESNLPWKVRDQELSALQAGLSGTLDDLSKATILEDYFNVKVRQATNFPLSSADGN